jgi:hypothetical protein
MPQFITASFFLIGLRELFSLSARGLRFIVTNPRVINWMRAAFDPAFDEAANKPVNPIALFCRNILRFIFMFTDRRIEKLHRAESVINRRNANNRVQTAFNIVFGRRPRRDADAHRRAPLPHRPATPTGSVGLDRFDYAPGRLIIAE